MTSRVAIGVAAAVLALAGLALIGRWEGNRAAEGQLGQLRAAFEAVDGRIDSGSLSAYRTGPPVCLFYAVDDEPFAVKLCFDAHGRLVESADRRGSSPIYATIATSAERATIVVPPAQIDSLVAALARR